MLDTYAEHIDRRMGEGIENCVVLLQELRELGYDGSCTILSEYVRPRRRLRQPEATMRFETVPGEQAQVDWGSVSYRGEDGKRHRVWIFVATLGVPPLCRTPARVRVGYPRAWGAVKVLGIGYSTTVGLLWYELQNPLLAALVLAYLNNPKWCWSRSP